MKKFLLVLFSVISSISFSQIDSVGRWFSRNVLPTPRQEIPHAVLNGKIYVPGGLAFGGVDTDTVEVFDPVINTWSIAASLPEPLHHLGFAAVNGRLYVLGGYRGNTFTPNIKVYAMNPDSNVWVEKNPMLIARGAHIALTFQNKIYITGGVITGFTVTNRTDVYDPITDSWQIVANMPTPREHLSGAVIDSLLYIAGGRSGNTNYPFLEAYSPASNIWYTLANMPTARGGLAAASLNGKLYVFGGEIPGVFPQNEQYNPAANQWRTMTPMKTPRHGIGAVTVGDSIYIIGGAVVQGLSVTNANDIFTLAPMVLNLTSLVQGFYNPGTNQMTGDTAKVILRKFTSPYAPVDSTKSFLNILGQAQFKFNRAYGDSNYYMVFTHRNSIETWSSVSASFQPSVFTYNFTTSASQAFGNNLVLKGTKFCVYGGDVNRDRAVDLSDIVLIFNAASVFSTGYIITDITGDNLADLSDVILAFNNSSNFVGVIRP